MLFQEVGSVRGDHLNVGKHSKRRIQQIACAKSGNFLAFRLHKIFSEVK